MRTPRLPISILAIVASSLVVAALPAAQATSTPAPAGAQAYFISPRNGEAVTSPFVVRFGLKGMGIAPAGVTQANTGHHHLLIDVEKLPDLTKPLPATDNIRHFGGGQTEVELTLPPGKHTLQLVLGDATHTPHSTPVMSEKITVTVK
ncbi:MAG: DUF4399 domain-containing protein [Acidobacteria bacterium]|nr:DUF4399 domain-containing protein [Acidobacteriota bacterium]